MFDETTMEGALSRLIEDPPRHARWLNTIALLEYTGARKMLKSQASSGMSEMILRHAAEESRHAHFFKRAALRIDASVAADFSDASLLCGTAAKAYFYELDHGFCERLKQAGFSGDSLSYASYLYVTTAIEERADWLYPIYHRLLRRAKLPISLSGIIAEEAGHLEEMQGALAAVDPDYLERIESLRPFEEQLFDVFLSQVLLELDGEANAA
jgi:hypothetical protein